MKEKLLAMALSVCLLCGLCSCSGSSEAALAGESKNDNATPNVLPATEYTDATREIRFDGLYQCQQEDYSYYLRFFSDGKVVETSNTGTPEQVIKILSYDYEIYGFYEVENGTIQFDTTSKSGSVSYSGRIVNSELIELDSVSHINGHVSNGKQYFFYELPDSEFEPNNGQSGNKDYIELNFSFDDVKFAGYSVNDGNHMSEVYQAVANELQSFPGQIPSTTRYDGWAYSPDLSWPGKLAVPYLEKGNRIGAVTYTVDSSNAEYMGTGICISYYYDSYYATTPLPVDQYPLLQYGIVLGSSYEDTVNFFRIANLIDSASGGDASREYTFNSQYGETTCRIIDRSQIKGISDKTITIDIFSKTMCLSLSFGWDRMLNSVSYEVFIETEPFDYIDFNNSIH